MALFDGRIGKHNVKHNWCIKRILEIYQRDTKSIKNLAENPLHCWCGPWLCRQARAAPDLLLPIPGHCDRREEGGGVQFFFYLLIHSISLLFIRIWLRQSSWQNFQFLRVASISFLELVPLVWPFSMHSLSVILNLWPKPQSKQPGKPKTIFKTQEHIGKQGALKTTTTATIQWQ